VKWFGISHPQLAPYCRQGAKMGQDLG